MRIWNRSTHAAALALAGAFAGLAAISAAAGELAFAAVIFGTSPLWYWGIMARWFRRRRLARFPFPPTWRAILERHVGFYRGLSADRRPGFECDVTIFIGENRFVGVDGVQVTDELKILAAASAVMLLFGRTDREYPHIPEILFYPGSFDEDFATRGHGRDIYGLNNSYGAVVLSVPDLWKAFSRENDGIHVGLHEFAHALDLEGQSWDGIPAGMPFRLARPWSKLLVREMRHVWNPMS